MAKTLRKVDEFGFPASILLEVLIDPEFEVVQQTTQEGTKDASVKQISRSDKRLVYEVHCVEFAKGVRGIDRSKTENSVTTVTWDLDRMRSSWEYVGRHGRKVRVWGSGVITSTRSGSRLTSEFNVNVKLPLIGGKIEKVVLKGAEKYWPTYERLVREFCEKRK